MKYIIYKLYFNKGIRTGRGKLSETGITLKADNIFSAIINEVSKYNEKLLDRIVESVKNDTLLLSDSFPFSKDELMLPKPMLSIKSEDSDSKEKKKFKKIKYVPISFLEEYLKGKSNPDKILKINENIGVKQLDTKIQYNSFGEHDIYNMEYFRFSKGSGLYFIVGYIDEELLYEINEILYNLSYTGIGGKKSIGLGRFEIIEEDLPVGLKDKINTKNAKMLLTTSMAKEDELSYILSNDSKYSLCRRGGYTYSESKIALTGEQYRKATLYFFNSGSIFSSRFAGDLFRIDNGFVHPIYRYSKPIWLEVIE